jgi:hypothetical protein
VFRENESSQVAEQDVRKQFFIGSPVLVNRRTELGDFFTESVWHVRGRDRGHRAGLPAIGTPHKRV